VNLPRAGDVDVHILTEGGPRVLRRARSEGAWWRDVEPG
jgi:hypothetical protein